MRACGPRLLAVGGTDHGRFEDSTNLLGWSEISARCLAEDHPDRRSGLCSAGTVSLEAVSAGLEQLFDLPLALLTSYGSVLSHAQYEVSAQLRSAKLNVHSSRQPLYFLTCAHMSTCRSALTQTAETTDGWLAMA